MRQRLAPIDMRTDISRARPADRDSSRFATLAQAMSSTKPTAPIIDASSGRIGPPIPLRKIATPGSIPLFVTGYCAASAEATLERSATA